MNNGYNVKYLQCDDVGEHGEVLKLVCVKFGVQLEMTGQGCPKRNGKVEHWFVTNGEQATAALIAAELLEQDRKRLWAEFAKTQSDLTNVLVSRNQETPPHTLLYKRDSNLPRHLIELGRKGFVHKTGKIKTKKFETGNTIPMLMCGYAANHA